MAEAPRWSGSPASTWVQSTASEPREARHELVHVLRVVVEAEAEAQPVASPVHVHPGLREAPPHLRRAREAEGQEVALALERGRCDERRRRHAGHIRLLETVQ